MSTEGKKHITFLLQCVYNHIYTSIKGKKLFPVCHMFWCGNRNSVLRSGLGLSRQRNRMDYSKYAASVVWYCFYLAARVLLTTLICLLSHFWLQWVDVCTHTPLQPWLWLSLTVTFRCNNQLKWCNYLILFWILLLLDSQRSHLSSFTMKLKDKFHSPKIKRTPSKKCKQLQPEPTAKSTEKPANKVCVSACVCVRKHICVYCGKYTFFPTWFCAFDWEMIVFLFHVLCSLYSIVSVCTWFSAGSHSRPVLQLALLQQVSKPI